jgi:uncharacterized membrane protein YedE/YeeE
VKLAHSSFWVGFLFAIGLTLSGMTQPQKVIGFLDIMHWDPTLIFVMLGSIALHAPLYHFIKKRETPLLDVKWHVPTRRDVTPQLVIGSALFGIGWSLGGFCPGPAVTSLAAGDTRVIAFVISMLLGMWTYNFIDIRFLNKS